MDAGVRPFLDAWYSGAVADGGRPVAAFIQDKSGRRAVRARAFVDATGDGDLMRDLDLPWERRDDLQPPTACAVFDGLQGLLKENPGLDPWELVFDEDVPCHLPPGFLWWTARPGFQDSVTVAGTRVSGADCSDADQLTGAEIEGRRQVRAMHDILRCHAKDGKRLALSAVCASIGVRETRHAQCLHRVSEAELLGGVRFPDAIANGTYPVDVHHSGRPGITFRRLDGTETCLAPGRPPRKGRWREPTDDEPTFYQVPYRSLVPRGAGNVLVAGRLVDADRGAYGALRVMVNGNQFGEAAGTACALALRHGRDVADVDAGLLRERLSERGAVII